MLSTIPLSWAVFRNWRYIRVPKWVSYSWRSFDSLVPLLRKAAVIDYDEFGKQLGIWNAKLVRFGGDPNKYKWESFRPLRLSREEDWSDWLGFLIESSSSGYFSRELFKPIEAEGRSSFLAKRVFREDVKGAYRADIVVNWEDDSYTHVEVKIGDMSFSKTFGTSLEMQEKYGPTGWTNFILLLPGQIDEWERIRATEEQKYPSMSIESILWSDVTISLRRSILFSRESLIWKAWALAYIGAVERKLLTIPKYARVKSLKMLSSINPTRMGIYILKQGRSHEKRREKSQRTVH